MIEMQKLQLETRDLMRKEFEAATQGILNVARAEATEAGHQMEQYMGVLEHIREMMAMQQEERLTEKEIAEKKTKEGD